MRSSLCIFLPSLSAALLAAPRRRAIAAPPRASDDGFLAGLQSRVNELASRQTKLPIVVLDSTLPGQRLAITTDNASFRELVEWCGVRAAEEAGDEQYDDSRLGSFGLVGVDRQTGGALPFGVEAEILSAKIDGTKVSVELKGGRRFTVDSEDVLGVPEGEVVPRAVTMCPPFAEEDEAAAAEAAAKLPSLVAAWENLVLDGGHEKCEDHLGLVRGHLGAMPAASEPSALALWIGAYINPLPALGVALEIRPALLAAEDASQRVQVALRGLETSIAHLDGSRRMW